MHWALLLERRRSQAVNDARVWSRKSPEGRDINLKTEISLSTQQHMVTFFGPAVNGNFFRIRKVKRERKEKNELRMSSDVSKIQWVSSPH